MVQFSMSQRAPGGRERANTLPGLLPLAQFLATLAV